MSKITAQDTTLQSTKQMLDELDALMEQMLSLPVNDPEEAPAFPKEVVKPHALTASLTMLEAPAPVPAPVVHAPLNAPHMAAPPAVEPLTNDAAPTSLLTRVEPLLAEVPAAEAGTNTLSIYQPLLWMNQSFDAGTMAFGGLGALMRTNGSRSVLGVCGLAMLAVSAGWFLKDWLGWNW